MKNVAEHRIIVIDNDLTSVNILHNILNNYNYTIDNAANEIEAADKIILNDYDFYFISDYINAGNLISLIKEIKKNSKIVIMSANSSFKSEEKIRSKGITYLLKKPFSEKEIRELIQ